VRPYKDGRKAKVHSGWGVRDHAVSLAFAVTDYKLEGKSLDVLVLSVGFRSFNPKINLSGIYVLASRVKTRAGLRVLKLSPWDHLKSLRPEVALEIWEQSYGDDHRLDVALLTAAASRAGERIRTAHAASKAGKKVAKAGLKAKATPQRKAAGEQQKITPHGKRIKAAAAPQNPTRLPLPGLRPQQPAMPKKRTLDHFVGTNRADPAPERWLVSVYWVGNSCYVDSTLKAWELAVRAAAEFAQGALAETTYFPPPLHARLWPSVGRPGQQLRPTESQLGSALQAWLAQAERVATSVDNQLRTMLGSLNYHRDAVRSELSRHQALIQPGLERGAREGLTEAQVLARIFSQSNQFGSERDSLVAMLRVDLTTAAGRQPNFLGGVSLPWRCTTCDLASDGVLVDSRLHFLTSQVLIEAEFDPILAFHNRYVVPQFTQRSSDDTCENENCGGLDRMQPSWYDASCVADSAPPLLGLCWDVNTGQAAANLLLHAHADFDAGRRDAAVLETSYGRVTYRLVALIFFNGSHFVTVGRMTGHEPDRWVCWDGVNNRGVGRYLRLPPKGHGSFNAEDGFSWSGFEASTALYCREPRAV